MSRETASCRVYNHGGELEVTRDRAYEKHPMPRMPSLAGRIPVSDIMTRDVVCARPDLGIVALTQLMVSNHIGCIPVVDERGKPKGIVTKLDLIARQPEALVAADVMMPLAITLNLHATVAHAAAVMSLEDFHHIMVVGQDGALAGVVSTMDVCRWLARNDGFLAG